MFFQVLMWMARLLEHPRKLFLSLRTYPQSHPPPSSLRARPAIPSLHSCQRKLGKKSFETLNGYDKGSFTYQCPLMTVGGRGLRVEPAMTEGGKGKNIATKFGVFEETLLMKGASQ